MGKSQRGGQVPALQIYRSPSVLVCARDLWINGKKSKDVYIRIERPLSQHLVKVTGRMYTVQLSRTFREKLIKTLKEQG